MKQLVALLGILFLLERVAKYGLVRRFFQREYQQTGSLAEKPYPKISILQPILSGDPTLWDCLAANLTMQTAYPLEFLWLVDEDDPAALSGCRGVLDRFPGRMVRLVSLPPPPDGVNPKLFKLIAGLERATGSIIAVLDDDTMLPDAAFEQCVPYLSRPGVGLAFGLPYYVNFSNRWSSLVAAFVNGHSLATYIPYTFLIPPFTINGMFYVIERALLARLGGFSGLETALCDDYAVAQRVRSGGYHLAQTPLRHGISTQVPDFRGYLNILTRWFIFPQASIMPAAAARELAIFYGMAVLPSFVPLLILAYALLTRTRAAFAYALLFFGLEGGILADFNRRYLDQATPWPQFGLLLLLKMLLPLHVLWALLAPGRIDWRGHQLRVGKTGGFHFERRRTDPEGPWKADGP